MSTHLARRTEMIPIGAINILNPRVRNRRVFREITDNIGTIGLKRPIKVSRRTAPDGLVRYDLICGQGRVEAFQALNQTTIPAIVVDVAENDCLVMSLVENVARRQHRAIDIMQEIGSLRRRGYSDTDVAKKIGVTSSWVGMIGGLLDNGEERLVAAVETGLLPISLAVEIARNDAAAVQRALADAYTQGRIKGKKLNIIRRLLAQRARGRKAIPEQPFGRKTQRKPLTAEQLLRVYRREADRQKLLVKKADFTQSRLMFIVEALKDLRRDAGFIRLLRAEGLDTMPRWLGDAIDGTVGVS
jgi:ParB family transcriptional regulator, chromosome partitioning protein